MIIFLNRKLRGFLLFILVLVAVSFIFFVDFAPSRTPHSKNLGKIRGEAISRVEFQQFSRETELSFTLTTGRMLSQFPGIREMIFRETWNRLITLRAAQDAGIKISPDEVQHYVTRHPLFQQDGKFNPARFRQFASVFFDPPGVSIAEGINLERFESAVRHQLLIEKFNRLLQTSAIATPEQVKSLISRLHGTSTILVAVLKQEDLAGDLKTNKKELEAFYQQHLDHYMNPEKRRINYVHFTLPPQTPDKGEQRDAAIHALGEKAFRFSDPFYRAQQGDIPRPDFHAEAEKAHLKVHQSNSFTASQTPDGIPGGEKVTQAAFSLTKENPVSDAIAVDDGFVILTLSDIQPSQPIPFAQASDRILEDYRKQELDRKLSVEGRQMALKLRQLLDAGAEWKLAIKESGFRNGPSFTLAPSSELNSREELKRMAARSASTLNAKETSPFERIGNAGYVFYITGRTPPTDDVVKKNMESTRQQIISQQGALLVREWVHSQYSAPGTELPFSEGNRNEAL